MKQEQAIVPRLRQLAELEAAHGRLKASGVTASVAAEIEVLRAALPTSILRHHDARRSRGKITVAPVKHGVCGACHLAIPRGRLLDLQRVPDGLNVCDHCGVFVYLVEESVSAESPGASANSGKLTRGRRPRAAAKKTVAAH